MTALMITAKVFCVVLRDSFINCLFDNILNVVVNRLNETIFHFSFFEKVIF